MLRNREYAADSFGNCAFKPWFEKVQDASFTCSKEECWFQMDVSVCIHLVGRFDRQ